MKNQLGKPMKGRNNWGGPRKRSKTIKRIQDKWCRDNGYPIIERRRYPHYRQHEN